MPISGAGPVGLVRRVRQLKIQMCIMEGFLFSFISFGISVANKYIFLQILKTTFLNVDIIYFYQFL